MVVDVGGTTRSFGKVYPYFQLTGVGYCLQLGVPFVCGHVVRVRQVPRSVDWGTCNMFIRFFGKTCGGVTTFFIVTPITCKRKLTYNTVRGLPPSFSVVSYICNGRVQVGVVRGVGFGLFFGYHIREYRGVRLLGFVQVYLYPNVVLSYNMVDNVSFYTQIFGLLKRFHTITVAGYVYTPGVRGFGYFLGRVRVNKCYCSSSFFVREFASLVGFVFRLLYYLWRFFYHTFFYRWTTLLYTCGGSCSRCGHPNFRESLVYHPGRRDWRYL